MKRRLMLLALILALFVLPAVGLAGARQEKAVQRGGIQPVEQCTQEQLMVKRGCCSKHKGVCGCRNGRVLCCDGTLSPTCTCLRDDVGLPN